MLSEEPLVQRKDPYNTNTLIHPNFYHVVLDINMDFVFEILPPPFMYFSKDRSGGEITAFYHEINFVHLRKRL